MTFMFFVFVLLLANLYSWARDIDLGDADYCIDWVSDKTELDRGWYSGDVRLVFVKKYNTLENHRDTIKCVSSHVNYRSYEYKHSATFNFVDKLGQAESSFLWIGQYSGDMRLTNDGRCRWLADCSDMERLNARTFTLPKVQIDFPPTTSYLIVRREKFNKDDLLRFKNRIIDARISQRVICESYLDTIYHIDFRVRITGECNSDSTEYKKNTQKNKLKKTNGNGNRSIEK